MTETYDVPYMQRTRDYYRAQGYTNDYAWAHYDSVPFQSLRIPLQQAKVTVITTAMPDTPLGRSQRAVYSTPITPAPQSLSTKELSWHHGVTHTDDVQSFLPLIQLNRAKTEGEIGEIAAEFHSVPTEYSKRQTLENDAPDILARCKAQEVDIAILIPL